MTDKNDVVAQRSTWTDEDIKIRPPEKKRNADEMKKIIESHRSKTT